MLSTPVTGKINIKLSVTFASSLKKCQSILDLQMSLNRWLKHLILEGGRVESEASVNFDKE